VGVEQDPGPGCQRVGPGADWSACAKADQQCQQNESSHRSEVYANQELHDPRNAGYLMFEISKIVVVPPISHAVFV